ncbi:MAG: hypothetical protein IJA88_00140 [Clostridia bacterium]|nr:hypothetical protein [Clostridia bacterium]
MNVSAIKKNFNLLGVEIKIFFTLALCADANGIANVNKDKLSKYIKVSRQTIGKYMRTFAGCNILKYKYSGKTFFNPEFYYTGPEELRAKVQEDYLRFKSDV